MSVLIDPPLWPAHGTSFSHLVSDVSLEELHAFARAAALPPRAFDRDHYDVPAHRHAALVAAGAEAVSAAELTRRLIRGGVRVPARERPDRHDAWLRRDFEALLPGAPDLFDDVHARWSAPERHYHDRRHLAQVLRGLDWLAPREDGVGAGQLRAARLAAWWHDAVYNGVAGTDEEDSATLAAASLSPLEPASTVRRVEELILMTANHEPRDQAAALLSDADLRVLARPAASYLRYVADVRRDYAHVSDAEFAAGRAAVLASLLGRERLYLTGSGHAAWEAAARANLEAELKSIERGTA
ncbi:MAG: DUF4031 domain-containing protein [Arthrobacter sp.]|jgi:predicted metal-dependent HD superfamily phosphohydrolase|nr:DUF4031 domain-containing protein [Arthrobacter sp.]